MSTLEHPYRNSHTDMISDLTPLVHRLTHTVSETIHCPVLIYGIDIRFFRYSSPVLSSLSYILSLMFSIWLMMTRTIKNLVSYVYFKKRRRPSKGFCHDVKEKKRENSLVVYYERIKREVQRRPIHPCRYDERLKTKAEGSTRLVYTGLLGGLDLLTSSLMYKVVYYERWSESSVLAIFCLL